MDSKSMLEMKSKGSHTSEKQFMLDVYAVRKAYKVQEIRDIGLVGGS